MNEAYRYTLVSEDSINNVSANSINVLRRYHPNMLWVVYEIKEK